MNYFSKEQGSLEEKAREEWETKWGFVKEFDKVSNIFKLSFKLYIFFKHNQKTKPKISYNAELKGLPIFLCVVISPEPI